MSLRIKATDVASVQERPLFFDTNVLLYLFGSVSTPSNQWAIDAYTTVFSDCIKMKSVICVDVFVLSEFVNRLLRLDYDSYVENNNINRRNFNFKTFRSTHKGIQSAQSIEIIVKDKILKYFNVVGKVFDKPDISSINLANTDFNDELIIKTCKEHQCVLITNDADFSGADIDILTANKKLS